MSNMQNDLLLYNQMDEIKGLVNQLLEKIENTQLKASSESCIRFGIVIFFTADT